MINIHNHTNFSDGKYTPEEIIKEGIKNNLKVLGISDHYLSTKVLNKSVVPEKVIEYRETIQNLSKIYKDKIKVFVGLEIDFSILRCDFTRIPFDEINKLDFLLFEYVGEENSNGLNIEELVKIRKYLKCEVGLAHNDLEKNFGKNYEHLISLLEENDIFVELMDSTRYLRGITPFYYFAENFFERIKNRKVYLSIGSDTHNNLKEVGNINNALDFVKLSGLEDKLKFSYNKLEVKNK